MKNTPTYRMNGSEIRASDGDTPKISGYAVLYNSRSENLGGFVEEIMPGAFTKTLQENKNIRCLWNHDQNYVLGNVANGTLTLRDDAKGLYFECIPPNTQYARDFTESIRRGDVRSCSFMFDCLNDTWSRDKDGTPLRQVKEARLYEVSAVVFPAYPATMVSARSILSNLTQAFEKRTNKAKEELTDEDKEELRAILLSINALLISDDDDEDDDADETEDQTSEPAPEVPETPESDQNFELDSAPNGEQCGVVQIEEQRQLDEIRLFLMSTI